MNDDLVYVKVFRYGKEVLVAVCDADLIGKTLREGDLEVCIDERFFKGSLVTVEKALSILETATIANLFGDKIVNGAKIRGLIHADAIIRISGVPHAQFIEL
ncbi:MAG: DUF424 family protein [Nitrososphaerota archaeon]|nr:DUF424 family protein [Candidatus Bathyarchaeota archaeon]MCX8161777.1 DUF424 family protein [Candidatus Bathyarchaeota archaeon]MDW8061891.1 DUF424 family protein [Nitrososphaerota archaeon]